VGVVTAATAPALLVLGRGARASDELDARRSSAESAPVLGVGVGHEHATQQPTP
jgi:hypothetical protein